MKTPAHIEKKICKLYKQGKSITMIAPLVKVAVDTAHQILLRKGITIRPHGHSHLVINKKHVPKIVSLYLSGKTPGEISIHYKCSANTIREVLKRTGVTLRSSKDLQRGPSEKEKAEIVALYLDNMSMQDLSKRYGYSATTICSVLKSQNVPIRSRRISSRLAHQQGKYRAAHEQGKLSSALENKFLAFVERKHGIRFERNQYGKRTFFAGGYYYDAKYKDICFEVDGLIHRMFKDQKESNNYHKRLQAADEVGCRVIRIPLNSDSKVRFNRAYQLMAPYLQ